MDNSLNRLLAALDALSQPVTMFLRDDDAGWDDARLMRLLDGVAACAVPLDLAVIPAACTPHLANELCARIDSAPALLGVHQHGTRHVNHEAAGRKCEFGLSRDADEQRRDIAAGAALMRERFGERIDAIFTPPWNRCTVVTPGLLKELGFSALSRDVTAPAQVDLPELPVAIDWCKHRRLALQSGDADGGRARLRCELVNAIAPGGRIGVMLHHAAMDEHDLAMLACLIEALRAHPQVRWRAMRELFTARARPVADAGVPFFEVRAA